MQHDLSKQVRMQAVLDDLLREGQYLEEKRRKLERLVHDRREEALHLGERNSQLVLQLRQLEVQRDDAQAEISRLQASREILQHDEQQRVQKFEALDADLAKKLQGKEAAMAEQLRSLQWEVDAQRLALQSVTEQVSEAEAAVGLLRVEKAAVAKQVLQEHALFEAVKQQAAEELVRTNQQLLTHRVELHAQEQDWSAQREEYESQVTLLHQRVAATEAERDVARGREEALQRRVATLVEEQMETVAECRGLVAVAEDLSAQLEDAKRATAAQAQLAREWREMVQQSEAVQRHEGTLRSAVTCQLQQLRIPHTNPVTATISTTSQTDVVTCRCGTDLQLALADLVAMHSALEEALAVQAEAQRLFDEERCARTAAEVHLRGLMQELQQTDRTREALRSQLSTREDELRALGEEVASMQRALANSEERGHQAECRAAYLAGLLSAADPLSATTPPTSTK
eukprot:GGOE01049534.1.p1 GENE.GGOE01049534.1~~GGOE01049534.1.p1  ORF type:complete len:458 (+),score=175.16 GGOE01049534.1:133-1506(+)